jgi:hypothetical protein
MVVVNVLEKNRLNIRLQLTTMTISSGTPIAKDDFNTAQATVLDILGLGDNGYGLPIIKSAPVENTQSIGLKQWNNLIDDINQAYLHVANRTTSTAKLNTGTSIVKTTTTNALLSTVDWLNNNRYTCHPSQFLNTGTSVATSTSTFFSDSTSTRTVVWGSGESNTISHELLVSFPSRTLARYYFNLGSYLTFAPYYQGSILFDADAAWANFIDYLRAPAQQYKYDRAKYVNYSSTVTSWTSGSLIVSVLAEKSVDERTIKFTTSYINGSPSTVYITPTGSTYPTITL